MPVTSPDNIWTPDSGDDYALTVDLARTADDVQDALNTVRGQSVPRLTASGRGRAAGIYSGTYVGGGAILNPGATANLATVTVTGTFPAGSVVTIWTQLHLAQGANADIAGNIVLRSGGSGGTILRQRRWHTHTRAGIINPSVMHTYVTTAAATNPQFSITASSDSISVAGIEMYDGDLTIVIDRMG